MSWMAKVTLDDIARETGFSKSTVLRVFYNRGLVKQDTIKIVEKAAERLGYVPRRPVVAENSMFDKAVMMISRDITHLAHVDYYRAISAEMKMHGYRPFLVDCNRDVEIEDDYVKYAIENEFGGIFIFSYFGEHTPPHLAESKVPIVLVNNYPLTGDYDVVCLDNFRCGYIATQHLIENGHRHIKFVGWLKGSITSRDRYYGFLSAMREAGLPASDEACLLETELTYKAGYELGRKLCRDDDDTTAIFFADSMTAQGVVDALYRHGKSTPADFSIVTAGRIVDNNVGRPILTSVGYDDMALGKTAAEVMMNLMEPREGPECHKKVVLAPVLKVGTTVRHI